VTAGRRPAPSRGRLGHPRALVGFSLALLLVGGISATIAQLAAPGGSLARCQPSRPCGAPPVLPQPLVNEQVYRSSQLRFTLDYPGNLLTVTQHTGALVQLAFADGSGSLLVQGTRSAQTSPPAAVAAEVSNLKARLSGLARDTQHQDALLGINVGYRPGVGGPYLGTFAGPQGPSQTAAIAIQSASDGKVTITTTAVVFHVQDRQAKSNDYQAADAVFNSIRWSP
jgi:hypothetical protein